MRKYIWIILLIFVVNVSALIFYPHGLENNIFIIKMIWSSFIISVLSFAISNYWEIVSTGKKNSSVARTFGLTSAVWVMLWAFISILIMIFAHYAQDSFNDRRLLYAQIVILLLCFSIVFFTNYLRGIFKYDTVLARSDETIMLDSFADRLGYYEVRLLSRSNINDNKELFELSQDIRKLKESIKYSSSLLSCSKASDYPLMESLESICNSLAEIEKNNPDSKCGDIRDKISRLLDIA